MTGAPFVFGDMNYDPRRMVGRNMSAHPAKVIDGVVEARPWEPTTWQCPHPTADANAAVELVPDEPQPIAPLQFDEAELAILMARAMRTGLEIGRDEIRQSVAAIESEALARIAAGLCDLETARATSIQATAEQLQILLESALDCLVGTVSTEMVQTTLVATVARCLDKLQGPIEVEIRVANAFVAGFAERVEALGQEFDFTGKLNVVGHGDLAPGAVEVRWAGGRMVRSPERIRDLITAEWRRLGPPPNTAPSLSADVEAASDLEESHER